MSKRDNIVVNNVYVKVPAQYAKVYVHILAALSDYGEDMLKDCKASCTDKDSGIIECFNMFNAGLAAYNLGNTKLADTIISYVESTLNLKYKSVVIPENISYPVEKENATIYVDFSSTPKFEIVFGDEIPVEDISIQGDQIIVGTTYQFSINFTPDDTTQRNIVWSIIQGSEYAIIDSTTGELYIKENANNNLILIKATSANDENIFDEKQVYITYDNQSAQGSIQVDVNTDLVEYGSQKQINVVVTSENVPARIELCRIVDSNINIISTVLNNSSAEFTTNIYGFNTYLVRAIFEDDTRLVSNSFELVGVPCCYLGGGGIGPNSWSEIYNVNCKLSPMMNIGSIRGKEYNVTIEHDGDYLYILVPRIEGHMNIDEIRMDATNVLVDQSQSEYSFDMDYEVIEHVINHPMCDYDCYKITLDDKGFKQDDYRIVITS